MTVFQYLPDSILTLDEVAQALRIDQRCLRRLAYALGGKRVGRCWRFRWGTVMEYFSDANFEERSRQFMAGESYNKWRNDGHQIFSARSEKRARMDGGSPMGDRQKKRANRKHDQKDEDSFGLRAALGLG